MKPRLMHADRDFDAAAELPANAEELLQDLELGTLLEAMAAGDAFIGSVCETTLLTSLTSVGAIEYRQRAVHDALREPDLVRQLYAIVADAVESGRKVDTGWLRDTPERILHRAVRQLDVLAAHLRALRQTATSRDEPFASDAFGTLTDTLAAQLDDSYLTELGQRLDELRLRNGLTMSAELGRGLRGVHYVLRRGRERHWYDRLRGTALPVCRFAIPDRDESGFRALSELRDRGTTLAADVLGQSAQHVMRFFSQLQTELAFYVGCINLHDRLAAAGAPACVPTLRRDAVTLEARELYDPCLLLRLGRRVTGNDVDAASKQLLVITGANEGGKSTFLRSVGVAQLMAQCGMFVAARAFRADIRDATFTHFKRAEDAEMRHGKLDEELARMETIVAAIPPQGLLLCNESFASTNEREGSEIARQVTSALIDAGVKVVLVTHLYLLAHRIEAEHGDGTLFLRAERRDDGQRTYRLVAAPPLPTSYGADLYQRVFGDAS